MREDDLNKANEVQVNRPHQRAQKYERDRTELFNRVIYLYIEARDRLDRHPICASLADLEALPPVNPFLLVEYCHDVETAIEEAAAIRCHEAQTLRYLRELAGLGDAGLSAAMTNSIIQECGFTFDRRGLDPRRYFRRIKQRRLDK